MVVPGAQWEPEGGGKIGFFKAQQTLNLRSYLLNSKKPGDPFPSRRKLKYPGVPRDPVVHASGDSLESRSTPRRLVDRKGVTCLGEAGEQNDSSPLPTPRGLTVCKLHHWQIAGESALVFHPCLALHCSEDLWVLKEHKALVRRDSQQLAKETRRVILRARDRWDSSSQWSTTNGRNRRELYKKWQRTGRSCNSGTKIKF